ncbi:hypothetical protein [Brevibacterium renqingii]|uniref:hypothetical protein n=1 Tax=Brevibacterium renqingii TaxID=2776916 RepID=UPI001ADF7BCE|nr:hypothetical protein [Brevibacterium renqingii]
MAERLSSRTAPGAFDAEAASARVTRSVLEVPGVTALAPGLRDLVATAAARVLRRGGGEPLSVDVCRAGDGARVRVAAHLDDSRAVAEIVDELFAVIEVDVRAGTEAALGEIDIDLRVVSRGR